MRKVRNLDQFERVKAGDKLLFPGEGVRTVSFEVNPYGPVAIYVQANEAKATKKFVGWAETPETFDVTVDGNVTFTFEPTGEVWVRHKLIFVVNENPGEGETYTRLEKMGLFQDELGIALHRQAVMQRIVAGRENYERDAYQRQLETTVADLAAKIEALTPTREEQIEQPAE